MRSFAARQLLIRRNGLDEHDRGEHDPGRSSCAPRTGRRSVEVEDREPEDDEREDEEAEERLPGDACAVGAGAGGGGGGGGAAGAGRSAAAGRGGRSPCRSRSRPRGRTVRPSRRDAPCSPLPRRQRISSRSTIEAWQHRRFIVGERVLVSRAQDGENHEEATVVDYYVLLIEGDSIPSVVVDFDDGERLYLLGAGAERPPDARGRRTTSRRADEDASTERTSDGDDLDE